MSGTERRWPRARPGAIAASTPSLFGPLVASVVMLASAVERRMRVPLLVSMVVASNTPLTRKRGAALNASWPLVGVSETDAMTFLSAYVGQRVVLLDGEEDSDGLRSGLVLLENHTFVNGHLLRTGAVAIDATTPDPLRRRLEGHAAKKAA